MRIPLVGMLTVLVAAVLPDAATAQAESPWLLRGRAIVLIPDASSEPSGLDLNADAALEFDLTRRLTARLALELALAATSQEVRAGRNSLGSLSYIPATLLLQLRPVRIGRLHPYLGAGGTLTFVYATSGGLDDLDLGGGLGWALQGGADLGIGARGVVNLDLKYLDIGSRIEAGGSKLYDLSINPWVLGAGFGYRF